MSYIRLPILCDFKIFTALKQVTERLVIDLNQISLYEKVVLIINLEVEVRFRANLFNCGYIRIYTFNSNMPESILMIADFTDEIMIVIFTRVQSVGLV